MIRASQLVLVSLMLCTARPAAAQVTFQGLGDLDGGLFQSRVVGLSADGSTVAGTGTTASGPQAFRWRDGSLLGLGFLPGSVIPFSEAMDISADGSVIVGRSGSANADFAPFRWDGAMIDLVAGSGLNPAGTAMAVSDDGSVVVGHVDTVLTAPIPADPFPNAAIYGVEAFRWNGSASLLLPTPTFGSSATVVSGDGSGYAGSFDFEGYTWAVGGYFVGPVTPDYIPGDMSQSGAVTVGVLNGEAALERPLEYIAAVSLGVLPGASGSEAHAVSSDGSIAVGTSDGKAFIWDEANGIRDLETLLTGLGVDLTGWSLTNATGISADGKTLAGNGASPNGTEAWLARIPTAQGVLSDARRLSADTSGGPGCGVTTRSRTVPPATPHFVADDTYTAFDPDDMTAAQDSWVEPGHFHGVGSATQEASSHYCAKAIFDVTFEVLETTPFALTATLTGLAPYARLVLEGETAGQLLAFGGDPAGLSVEESGDLAPDVYRITVMADSVGAFVDAVSWAFDLSLDPGPSEPPSTVPSLDPAASSVLLLMLTTVAGLQIGRSRRVARRSTAEE